MAEPNKNPPKIGVSQIKKIVSKVIIITPKQIAEMGLQNQLKNVKMGTIIGQIPEAKSGDGTSSKPIKAALLSNLRTKMSTLLNHSPFVMQVDPKNTVDLVYKDVNDEACDAAEVIEIISDVKEENVEQGNEKKIEVLSDQVVHYSSDDLNKILDGVQEKSEEKKSKAVILNNNKLLQKKIVSKSSDSENLLYVPDLPAAAASQITTISSDSEREFSPERDNKDVDLDTLIAAKKVLKDAAARTFRTVPKTFTPSAFRQRQVLRTYSKVQSISVIGGPEPRESHKRIIRIHKRAYKRKSEDDDEDWVSPKRYYKPKKSRDNSYSTEEELQTSVEEKVRRIMDECKEKEPVEQVVAPKKRGRPRKTPLQPKVDVEPTESEKEKKQTTEKTEKTDTVTPRKRGRPRKVSVDPKDDKSDGDNTPKKKQRRRKSDADEREFSAPSSTPGGVRTSGRKRKVVDYAALSGGRISSSEEEDFAEIERLTGIKHETSEEEESDEEIQREDEEDKEKTSSKTEAVHPLKKRLKMEHAQAAEKEKADENEEKKDGKENENNKHDTNDVQNNTLKENKERSSTDKDKENNATIKQGKSETENSMHKNDKVENNETNKNSSNEKVTEKSESRSGDSNRNDNQHDSDKEGDSVLVEIKVEDKSDIEGNISCGVCKETFNTESEWVKHKQGRHNNLAWKVGEPPLDLENYDLVYKTLTVTLKQYGALVCEVCGEDYSSAVKFIKHVRKCKNVCFDYEKQGVVPGTSVGEVIKTIIPNVTQTVKKGKRPSENGESAKIKNGDQKSSSDVKCAVCEKILPKTQWFNHKTTKHNNLAWKEGEEPLDLENKTLVKKILTDLYKQKKPLICEICGEKKKSVIGFISHKQQCQKSTEELDALKVSCHLCNRRMLPVSLPSHMQFSHSNKDENKESVKNEDKLTPRKAAQKAIDVMQKLRENEKDSNLSKKSKKIIKNINFTTNEEVLTKFKNDIDSKSHVKCIYENCNYQTENINEFIEHLNNCDKKIRGNSFTCNFCLATFIQWKDVVEHLKIHDNKSNDIIIKDIDEDNNFVADEEEEIDPLEYAKDDVEVTQMNTNVSKRCGVFRAKFMSKVMLHKKPWSVFSIAYGWTKEFADLNYNDKNLFPNWCVNEFKSVQKDDVFPYLPSQKESIDVSRTILGNIQDPLSENLNWKKYKLFEGEVLKDGTSTIFCGGPVNCIAWVPTPHIDLNQDQILSISVLPNPEKGYSNTSNHFDKSLIQFWNFGSLKNGNILKFTPKLEFCLAHKYGLITNLEWCPSGCFDLSEEKTVKRLGILAVATGDKFVYIYSIPQPNQIKGKLFQTKPLVKLSLSKYSDIDIGDVSYFPTKTSWTKFKGHKYIAVGYSNGVVGIYCLEKNFEDITENTLYPIQYFHADCEAITALVLSHYSGGNRFLITGSTFKDLKLWNLEDTSDAVFVTRKYPITDLTWNIHWITPVVCYDSISTLASTIIPLREHNGVQAVLSPFSSRVTTITSNDWGNLFVNCSDSGEVVVYLADQMYEKYEYDHKRRKPRYLLSYTGIFSKKLSKDENKAIQTNKLSQLKGKGINPENAVNFGPQSYQDVKDNYGLIFCDMDTNINAKRETGGPSVKHDKFLNETSYSSIHKCDLYPMQSIAKAALNQNPQSFHYYALGYQVGFVRVSKISFLNKSL